MGSEEMAGGAMEEFGFNEKKAEVDVTPVKKARARPLLEQMLGRSRPKPMYEDDESSCSIVLMLFVYLNSETGVLCIVDAAANDLVTLINNFYLQATPNTLI
ncbi:hypothetical protein CVT25_014365 [Psilocybe cyanescens]|uniref:Uncharacterized protein n=1 Tax=Psilocybe cyanescens TaxID=93625 RepID=A0A409XPE6_PSICY|nr:hypothetical protein CVT25_014365 [Psilocybe cyanescens]